MNGSFCLLQQHTPFVKKDYIDMTKSHFSSVEISVCKVLERKTLLGEQAQASVPFIEGESKGSQILALFVTSLTRRRVPGGLLQVNCFTQTISRQ
jgi:hypothetical protein